MEIGWTVHPARRSPGRAAASLAMVLLCAAFAVVVGGHAVWGIAAATFLVLAIATFLFPTAYRLSGEGVEVRVLGARRRRAWSDLRLVAERRDGVLLSTSVRPGLFEPVRAIFLRFPEDPEPVRNFVRERLGA